VLGAPGVSPAGRGPARRRRKIAFGAVFGTAALAFVIAVAALTLPELVAGESVGRNDGRTTLFGGKKSDGSKERAPQETTEEQQPTTPDEEQQPTTPEETTPAEEPPAEEETTTETAPAEPLQETTPVPPPAQP
jgi:outer membrane biosynthesis protein TonB